MNDKLAIDNYWINLLHEYDESITIPTDIKMQKLVDSEIHHISVKFSAQKELLTMKAAKLGVTESAVIETALALVLQRYNYSNDVVFGKTLLCNQKFHFPVRVLVNSSDTIEDTIRCVDSQWDESLKNSVLFEESRDSILKLDLINIAYIYIENHEYELCKCKNMLSRLISGNDLVVCVVDSKDALEIMINYDVKNYSYDEIELFLEYFTSSIDELITTTKIELSELELMSQSMKHRILNEFNTAYFENEYDISILEIFEEHARTKPNKKFASYLDREVYYGWMNDRANQLAWTIKKLGVEYGELILLSTERSIEMVIGMLGILKAGAAFVPVNQQVTKERFEYLSKKCKARIVLTYNSKVKIDGYELEIIDLGNEVSYSEECTNIERGYSLESNAFCLFTSGTTGEPKGVLTNHKGFTASLQSFAEVYDFDDSDTVLQFSDYTYVQGLLDIFNIMVVGGSVCLLSEELVGNLIGLEAYCDENNVTYASLTPTIIAELNPSKFQTVRILDTTGEPADAFTLNKWLQGRQIMNSYGTTELSGNTSSYHYQGENVTNVPIGKPADNAKYYIIDKFNRLCGQGMIGELCVASVGVSNGYLDNLSLTEERFIKNPYLGGLMYRTGDLAKWLSDGNVECLGRIDNQVKIRGCRVELAGIKNTIMQIDGIDDCAVITRNDPSGDKVICAYLVSKEKIDISELTKIIEKRLSSIEVPKFIMQIPHVPSNKNGKLDKTLLPDICLADDEYANPKMLKEKILCRLLAELFNVPRVSLKADFFELGGDSIKAIRLASRLKTEGYILSSIDILRKHRVKELADVMVHDDETLAEEKKSVTECNISSEDLDILNDIFNL